jgi:ankyrin repeat protein
LKRLVQIGVIDLKSRKTKAEDEILAAVLSGDIDAVEAFLAQGSDINARDRAGRTPLMNAVIDRKNHW